ncbi:hypothetical protein BV898_05199 [Hypsibius exemplaris]|uniref:Kinesin motor domain-containing protein n=1 Tax=Hypsibius exemplaris TaxID=2072580 RepID=A0A1W0X058_HYPEX|nr:hypothetical protein BV898_05199 [Hypsibius exemplaris]
MPKTKVSSKKKVLSECQAEPPVPPRLDDLKKLAAGEEDLLMDELEEQENFELEVETPKENQKAAKGGRTFIRTPRNANGGGAGITTLDTKLTKKNLGNLFKMEETMIETIRLEDTGRSHHHHHHEGLTSSASHIAKAEAMDCFIRVRPLLPQEVARGENKGCFKVLPEAKGIALIPPVASHLYRRLANSQDGKVGYDFTHVLGDELQQRDVFIRTMHKPIQQFLGGTSQLIFTYGVTNSGKTYTLLGKKNS